MLGFGRFELHPQSRRLCRDGEPLALRGSAFEVLLALLERPGEVVAKRLLCERAWPGRDIDENSLQVEVSALRKLIGADAIVTASGRGYQFAWAVTRGALAATGLLGREADLAALQALCAPGELVSVVGEGGVGKTRLALALAQRDAKACIAQVDEAHDEAAVLRVIGAALGVAGPARRALLDALKQAPRLLLLDTCDAALQPLAELAGVVMAECPGISLLATSREALRVPGERVYRLAPLADPAAQRLFSDRLGASAEAVCRQLGGNPLAIERVARHAAEAGIAATRDSLHERLDWLGDTRSAVPARQRSLRASLDWSCRSLSRAERRVLTQLASLAQPFGFDDLLALPLEAGLGRWERLDTLGRLVDKSLLGVDHGEKRPMYRLSAEVQLYARSPSPQPPFPGHREEGVNSPSSACGRGPG